MVLLDKIYTRSGDKGRTSLADGSRVAKYDLRVETYGAVDEANAHIGLARLEIYKKSDGMLARIQNDLFDLGADLARPPRLWQAFSWSCASRGPAALWRGGCGSAPGSGRTGSCGRLRPTRASMK